MMKIIASLVILGLCANVCVGLAPTSSAQSGAFSASLLNSTTITIVKGTNSTDAAVWDSSTAAGSGGTPAATSHGISISDAWFGPGATNDTSYLWGIQDSASGSVTSTSVDSNGDPTTVYQTTAIRKRTINNTIVGWGNDTVQASVIGDTSISLSVMGMGTQATGPGYVAMLTTGYDSTTGTSNNQVWVTLVSGVSGSASTTKLTTTSDTFYTAATVSPVVACTATSFTVGNIWYDIGSGAFWYTYSKMVKTYGTPSSAGACASGSSSTYVNTIYLGGIYLNNSAVMTAPISAAPAVPASGVDSLMGGVDNTNAATSIYLVYQDDTTEIIYSSKTTLSANTSAISSFSQLAKAPASTTPASAAAAGTNMDYSYTPVSVWSSNNTYAITIKTMNTSTVWTGAAGSATAGTPTYTYGWMNFFNGTTTGVDSGLTSSATTYGVGDYWGWQLNTGYTVVAQFGTATEGATTYTFATYFANGTANMTATTVGSLTYGAPQFYEDVNGTQWIGWFDVDTANSGSWVYGAYLAKFQGQLNIDGANVLSALSAVVVFFLASIFIF